MSKIEERLNEIFPTTVSLTPTLAERGREVIYNCNECVGAVTLKQALGEETEVLTEHTTHLWGDYFGIIKTENRDEIYILAHLNDEPVSMMRLPKFDENIDITFKIVDGEYASQF